MWYMSEPWTEIKDHLYSILIGSPVLIQTADYKLTHGSDNIL